MNSCPTPETLLGLMQDDRTGSLARHVEGCDHCQAALDEMTGPAPPWPGLPDVGGHRVEREIGGGGMGVVYEARDAEGRPVALKVMREEMLAGPGGRARFAAEVQALRRLRHPWIVEIFNAGEDAGRPFLTMELASGPTLARALGGRPVPPLDAARIALML
ncbi:MAG: protein kinase domain-containing protein, partial [Gemmataceae bacterium]